MQCSGESSAEQRLKGPGQQHMLREEGRRGGQRTRERGRRVGRDEGLEAWGPTPQEPLGLRWEVIRGHKAEKRLGVSWGCGVGNIDDIVSSHCVTSGSMQCQFTVCVRCLHVTVPFPL